MAKQKGQTLTLHARCSGFIFKDSVEVVSVEDPEGAVACLLMHACMHGACMHGARMQHNAWRTACACKHVGQSLVALLRHACGRAVEGITIYISDFKRSLADKLSKDFFTEPSQVGDYHVITMPQTAVQPERGLCSLRCQSTMTWP